MENDRPRKVLVLGSQGLSCTSCAALCHSIHQPVSHECHISGCYICEDLVKLNDKITRAYKRLSQLAAERQKFLDRPRHGPMMHRMPVEIVSLIFGCVRELDLDSKPEGHPDYRVPKPPFRQPSSSMPLLLGGVCTRWRDISMTIPQLWTDLTINVEKEGQSNMVKEWARRAGALPLDITLFTREESPRPRRLLNILSALRPLAHRWHNLTLSIPGGRWHRLFDKLEDTPPINSLFVFGGTEDIEPIKLPHPLRPRALVTDICYGKVIPFGWDRLEFLKHHDYASIDEVLHIIRQAGNLKHCILGRDSNSPWGSDSTARITHPSIISLVSIRRIIRHLTLPALQHLDYSLTNSNGSLDELVKFLDRSHAPLNSFTVRCRVSLGSPFPRLEKLYGVTSLFLQVQGSFFGSTYRATIETFLSLLLPSRTESLSRLEKITFELHDLTASQSWISLGRMFNANNPPKTGTQAPQDIPKGYLPTRTSSGVPVRLSAEIKAAMKKRPFLRLLEVKQSGVDIHIVGSNGTDVLIL